ncbi:phytoene desaturase family protein [Rubritalea tangerina]|uniref:Phytoene desaturase family protein n=2 Tax=Rubritalea tangerina TaxID=430798 RepID=A0ABW4ZF32_9BACT
MMPTSNKSVIVIGAGLGGLSAAISLRAAGYAVTIYEKNAQVGGKLNHLEKDGFSFDLGPSIFTLPQIFEALFKRANRKMDDYVKLVPVTPHWRNFFEDNTILDLYQEPDLMRNELNKLQGSADHHWQQLEKFLAYARQQYQATEDGYFDKGIDTMWELIRHYHIRLLTGKIDYNRTMSEAISQHFDDPYLRSIFEYFIKYVGSSALASPGYMNLMPIIQFDYGLWYVDGGMYALAQGLEKLVKELGITLHLNHEVAQLHTHDNAITQVAFADGSSAQADWVVSNMEVIPAYRDLLKEDPSFTQTLEKKFEPACSGLVIHIGTDREYPQLAHHNFFYSQNQSKHFHTVFDKHRLPDDPTIYLVAPTRTDPSKAPPGHDNLKILPHIPPLQDDHTFTESDYLELEERVLIKLERMGLTDLRKHIVTRDVLTPFDIERMYRSNKGSVYGVVTDWNKNKGFKAPKKSSKYNNLYFVGGSVNPGGGMPMVVLSGQKAADRIIAEDQ